MTQPRDQFAARRYTIEAKPHVAPDDTHVTIICPLDMLRGFIVAIGACVTIGGMLYAVAPLLR